MNLRVHLGFPGVSKERVLALQSPRKGVPPASYQRENNYSFSLGAGTLVEVRSPWTLQFFPYHSLEASRAPSNCDPGPGAWQSHLPLSPSHAKCPGRESLGPALDC